MFYLFAEICFGLVLALSHHYHFSVVLPLPDPQILVDSFKTQLMGNVEKLTTHLIPALSFALIIRKLTS